MNLKVNMELPVSILAEDEFGNVTSFDSAPAWSVADASLGVATASDDGMSAVFVPSGKLGVTQLQVLGVSGGNSISGSMDLVLIAGDATQVVLQPGTPVPAPAPAV